jgi:hypothetical protein
MKRSKLVTLSLAGLVSAVAVGATPKSQRDAAQMAAAASDYLAALSVDQRARGMFALDSDERLRFHFIPPESYPRNGVTLREMDEGQRALAHDFLKTGLSQRGYMSASQIMELEDVLLAIEGGGRMARDREEYYFSVFGIPAEGGTWAWRFEGHHLSLHFSVVEGAVVSSAPGFWGANPAEVREGPQRGVRPLGDREDAARVLLESLDRSQREVAIVADEAPRDIVTGAELEIDRLSPVGVRATDLSASQRGLLMDLIGTYLSVMAEDIANDRLSSLRAAGLDGIGFAWAGEVERGQPHYYRVQGPTFLIEYDNTQNNANHIHSVWRDFDGDFGRDLLREHLRERVH